MARSKKVFNLKDDHYRIIKISKEALLEFVYETINDHQESIFDIGDATRIVSHHYMDYDTGEYICLIRNTKGKALDRPEGIDLEALVKKLPDTTDTLYKPGRYVEMTLEEIKDKLQAASVHL